ncbi:MAG TPA: response regulator, partial [Myxococcota bacterium]|nr:response regulator [Myxococcota bacterium]
MSVEPRLLVVDDEEVVCKTCSRIFEGQGYRVETATDPQAGLAMATKGKYAVILLDIKMPAMDGLAFLAELRKQDPRTPVIMVTGYPSVPSAATAMRLGAADYVSKPFTPDEITGAVRRVLGGAATHTARPAAGPLASASAPAPGVFTPMSEEFLFLGESWIQVGQDGTVRAGAFLSKDEGGEAREVVLPRPGDNVFQGLPLVGFRKAGSEPRSVPSPVTGEVVEVNPALATRPSLAWEEPCRQGWIARIRPSRLPSDLKSVGHRVVVLACPDKAACQARANALGGLGCEVL